MESEDGAGNGGQWAGNGAARQLSFSGSPPQQHSVQVGVFQVSESVITETVAEPTPAEHPEIPPTQPDPPAPEVAPPAPTAKACPLRAKQSGSAEEEKVSIYDDGMYWKLLGYIYVCFITVRIDTL